MVVVDPDETARRGGVGDRVGETFVHAFVGLPGVVVEDDAALVMQVGPEDGVWGR